MRAAATSKGENAMARTTGTRRRPNARVHDRGAAAAIRTLARPILKAHWDFHPTTAQSFGLHEYDGKLPNYSAAAVEKRVATVRSQVRRLRAIDPGSLMPNDRLDRGILIAMLEDELFDFSIMQLHRIFPPYYLWRMNIVNYLLRTYAPLEARMRAVARLLEQVPRFVAGMRATLRRSIPDTCYEVGEQACEGIIEGFEKELPEAAKAASAATRKRIAAASAKAVASLRAFLDELRGKYKPRVTKTFALGPTRYRRMIRFEHGGDIPLERLRAIGKADLERNKAAFMETAKKIDPTKPPQEVMGIVAADHSRADTLIPDTANMLEEIRDYVVRRKVVTVPSEVRCQVIETPRFYRFATAALNPPGSFEKKATEAFYYVTPVEPEWPPEKQEEWLRHLNTATLQNISVHEAYPGHYVHFLHRARVVSDVAKSHYSYAFTEGWAHYCEEMMVDEGFGGGDPKLRLVQLQDALLRNCRYLSSIAMHTGGWGWEDATEFFMENAFLDRLPAEREAKRGTWDPGYLNYTLGKLIIKKLREDFFREHAKSTLTDFHDELLSLGAPPLALAREHMLRGGGALL